MTVIDDHVGYINLIASTISPMLPLLMFGKLISMLSDKFTVTLRAISHSPIASPLLLFAQSQEVQILLVVRYDPAPSRQASARIESF
jgi:hypothetical protein